MRSRPPRQDATIGVIQTSPTRSSSVCGPPNGSGLLSLLSRRQPREASIGRYPPPPGPRQPSQARNRPRPRRLAAARAKLRQQRMRALTRLAMHRLTSNLNLARLTRTHLGYEPHDPSPPPHAGQRIPADSDGPTPPLNIGPTNRRATATINTGASQRAPPISPKTGALFSSRTRKVSPVQRPRAPPSSRTPKQTTSCYRAPMPASMTQTQAAVPNSSDTQQPTTTLGRPHSASSPRPPNQP